VWFWLVLFLGVVDTLYLKIHFFMVE
jgi:hypothetical protein